MARTWQRRTGRMRRATCPTCQREVAVYRPTYWRGPGVSGDVYRAHRTPSGADCLNSGARVAPDAYVGEEST